jgi:PKD repeat protein
MRHNAQVLICTVLLASASCSKDEAEIQADPISDFTVPTTLEAVVPIQFQNASENADTYSWDFGDGNVSQDTNPVHTYATPGSYQVSLTATRGSQTATSTKTITISTYDITTNAGARFAGNYLCKVVSITNTPFNTIKARLPDEMLNITRQSSNTLLWNTISLAYRPANLNLPQLPSQSAYRFYSDDNPPRTYTEAKFHTLGDSATIEKVFYISAGGSQRTIYYGRRQN